VTVQDKIRILERWKKLFPIATLTRQSSLVYRSFEIEIADARAKGNSVKADSLDQDRHFELQEYEEGISAIRTRRLLAKSRRLYLYLPDLKWERGAFGHSFLEAESLSKLYHSVREESSKRAELRLKLIGALTGIIGALIGLAAVLKK
jgi:hypothetical protein